MWVLMVILAVGSLGAGAFFAINNRFADWLAPTVGAFTEHHEHSALPADLIPWLTIALSALGALIAWLIFRRDVPVEQPQRVSFLTRAARKDLYGNALNETLVARP